MKNSLIIEIPAGKTTKLTKYWLVLAVMSLAAAGIFSLPPVIFRGSFFANMLPIEKIFDTSLIVHVDLSVLVWFLAIGGLLMSLLAKENFFSLYKTNFILAALGTALIALAPFTGGYAIKNNYIPTLNNLTFFLGLSFFACGILFQCAITLTSYQQIKDNVLKIGIFITAVIVLVAFICFVIAHNTIPTPLSQDDLQSYYEALFWGGGHVLQFAYISLMAIAWLWLSEICNVKIKLPTKFILMLFVLNMLIILPSPFFYMSENTRDLFTQQMRAFCGISPLFIGASIFLGAFNKNNSSDNKIIKSCLIISIILFGYGGALGYMISGTNVTIPAHYHGSIIAITIAFIGFAYHLLPQLGFGKISGKMASCQPYVYGIGQIMHITGLAWMGGYGALRKAAGTSHEIHTVAGKALFFSGGALAITGGLLFVIVAIRALLKK